MTGVSINCWQASIGLFNARNGTFHYKTCKTGTNSLSLLHTPLSMPFMSLRRSLIFQISFGLFALFTFSAILFTVYPLIRMR